MDKHDQMREIRDELLNLTESPLYKYRVENKYFPVIGEGSHDAKVVFIGEAPGEQEAKTARPFCGRSGKLLDEMLASIGLSRESVYITNLVKDRPPENRDPSPEEILLYSTFLDRQLQILKPLVVVMLGRHSMNYLFEKAGIKDLPAQAGKLAPISVMHGKVFAGDFGYGEVLLIPLYHPAVGLYNPGKRPELFSDFAVIKRYI